MLSMLAVLAVSAVASASASAACPFEKEGDLAYCVAGAEVGSPTEFKETFATNQVESYKLSAAITIVCKKLTGTGEVIGKDSVNPLTNANVNLTFSECSIEGQPKCDVRDNAKKLSGTIEVKGIKSEVKLIGTVVYDIFKSATGTFVTLEVVNHGAEKCPTNVAGKAYDVKGETAAELEPLGTDLVKGEVDSSPAIDKAAGVGLKLKGVAATFEGAATLELTGVNKGSTFGVMES
jgi:hypothetical protein